MLLYVSLADRFVLPDVNGLDENEATQILEPHVSVTVTREQAAIEPGRVVRTDPPAGEAVAVDSEVHLFLSLGGLVPEVVGMSRDDAYATLKKLDYVMDSTDVDVPSDSPNAGVVISQVPQAGSALGSREHVAVTTGRALPPANPTTTRPPTSTSTTMPST